MQDKAKLSVDKQTVYLGFYITMPLQLAEYRPKDPPGFILMNKRV